MIPAWYTLDADKDRDTNSSGEVVTDEGVKRKEKDTRYTL